MSSLANDQDLVDYQEDEDQTIEDKDKTSAGENATGRGSYVAVHTSGFRDFFLKPELLRAIGDAGFEHPSEVQHETIPHAITGVDILCQAKSGMGKTAVFVLSILQQLTPETSDVMCIGLAHTRELAFQIKNEFDRFSKHMRGIICEVVFGGVPIQKNIDILSKPETTPHILIGSPGRLLALLRQGHLKTDKVAHFVLDECDKCLEKLDMRKDVQEIFTKTPKKKQVMMFSATLSREIRDVCRRFLQNPVEVFVDDETKLTLHGLIQHYLKLSESEKNRKLNDLLDKLEFNQVIIFVKSVQRAQALDRLLTECSFPSICIHAGLEQIERIARYQQFKNFEKRIMVATDLFGRGIDIERVNIVINYDMPDSTDSYLHRVGRAGRFGTKGLAITFVASQEDSEMLNQVQARFEVSITEIPPNLQSSSYNHQILDTMYPYLRINPPKIIQFTESSNLSDNHPSVVLVLENTSATDTIAFKVKTTAPKHYLVRPSNGVILPGQTQDVKLVLHIDADKTEISGDRFLVQAAILDPALNGVVDKSFWENVSKDSLRADKLSVVYKSEGADFTSVTQQISNQPLQNSSGSEEVERKYNDVVQYCVTLESEKRSLASEVELLKQQLSVLHSESGVCRVCNSKQSHGYPPDVSNQNAPNSKIGRSLELWQAVAMIVAIFAILKVCQWL